MSAPTTELRIGMATRTDTDAPAIEFCEAPLGLMGLRHFRLHALDDAGYLFALRSVEAEGVRLFVVPPEVYFPTYAPRIPADALTALELGDQEPAVLTVVTPGDGEHAPTANLLAPVVVNPTTGAALQVVLDSDEWPLRAQFTVQG
ncbi:flagellar assembly protein FliW [Isoptericola sp. b441]|uniref:Flagellar assembly protein FliW n=1 Tax=Actinotalea lenta TaxID=3064654 RepID=A0ABT9D6J4_9CELL|nr:MULTISPECIES: flagellar assembly protein FliW [unclassified Isoptericola]MDO8106135.1 flagellar assembly protein FliW [Isoptericola sp. b441]MDO8122146.1 flagellar assembly protein FliW [Isoptericola sp. b490]